MKYIGTMLSVFQRHNCICQVIIWTPERPISYASESLIVIFLPWYNCCVYVLNGNKMFLNWMELNWLRPSDTIWHHRNWLSLLQVMAWHLISTCHYWNNVELRSKGPLKMKFHEILIKMHWFIFKKNLKCCQQNVGYLVQLSLWISNAIS